MRAEDVSELEERLLRWLDSLPTATPSAAAQARHAADVVAHRAAMRALPNGWADSRWIGSEKLTSILVAVFRAALVSGVATVDPRAAIRAAAARAAETALSAAMTAPDAHSERSVDTAAYAARAVRADAKTADAYAVAEQAVGSAFTEPAANAAFWRSVRDDCVALAAGQPAMAAKLWARENPHWEDWVALRAAMLAATDGWGFWVDWYDRALEGRPQDWDLLTEVALIPSEDWEKGAEHVNGLIVELVARRNRQAEPSKPDSGTVEVIRQVVAANREAVPLMVEGLLAALEAEKERLRGDNSLEPEVRERLLGIFDRMAEAARGIGSTVPQTGPVDAAMAEGIGSWASVLSRTAHHWNREAKKVVLGQEADARVTMAGRVVLGGAVAGVLTAVGLPAYAAVAGGAILLKDKVSEIGKAIGARLPGGG